MAVQARDRGCFAGVSDGPSRSRLCTRLCTLDVRPYIGEHRVCASVFRRDRAVHRACIGAINLMFEPMFVCDYRR